MSAVWNFGMRLGHRQERTMTDLWMFQRWAREQKLGSATRKLILTSLAITAEAQTGSGFMAQADLAEYAECSTRTVSEHLKALEASGHIARRRRFSRSGRRIADGFLLLAPGVTEWPDGEQIESLTTGSGSPPEETASGDLAQSPPEAQASEQEQPIEQPGKKEKERAREEAKLSPPPDFPEELRPHARAILPILEAIAEQHGAARVYPLTLGKTLMRYRLRPLVATAHDMDRWAVDAPRQIRDVVSTYATFLSKTRDMQGVERLNDAGLPTTAGAGNSAGSSDTVGNARFARFDRRVIREDD